MPLISKWLVKWLFEDFNRQIGSNLWNPTFKVIHNIEIVYSRTKNGQG